MSPIVTIGYASTNYYVLGSSTTRLLIDGGWPGTLHKLMVNLRRTGIPCWRPMRTTAAPTQAAPWRSISARWNRSGVVVTVDMACRDARWSMQPRSQEVLACDAYDRCPDPHCAFSCAKYLPGWGC